MGTAQWGQIITEEGRLISIPTRVLLPWIRELCLILDPDGEKYEGWGQCETHNSELKEKQRRWRCALPCCQIQNADLTFLSQCCLSIVACGRGAFMQLRPGPFLQPADRPVDAVNQAKTSCWGNGDRASKVMVIYWFILTWTRNQQNMTQWATSKVDFPLWQLEKLKLNVFPI